MRSVRPGASTGSSVCSCRRRDLAGRHGRLDDDLHEGRRVLTRVDVHHRRGVVGLSEDAHVARDANHLRGDWLAKIDDYPLAQRVFAAEVFARHPPADDRGVTRARTIGAIVECPAGDDRDAERAEVLSLDPPNLREPAIARRRGRPALTIDGRVVGAGQRRRGGQRDRLYASTRHQPLQQRDIEAVDARVRVVAIVRKRERRQRHV
jgi:hypothetical protein